MMKDLFELIKKTKQELTNDEEMFIRQELFNVFEKLGRQDVIESIKKSIPEMDKDNCDNLYKVTQYIHTLHDVIMLSR